MLVGVLEIRIIACALFNELDDTRPVTQLPSHVQGKVLSIDFVVDLLRFLVAAKPGTDLSLLL